MTFSQYRITFNGDKQPILDCCPIADWQKIAEACEDRGYEAVLERRLVCTGDDVDLLDCVREDDGSIPKGYLRIKPSTLICPWEVIAEMKPRQAVLVGH